MDPLSQLKDIHLPTTIGYWPPAYGWWILLLLGLIGIGGALFLWRKKYQRALARRQALQMLSSIGVEQNTWPQQLNSLLKRLALAYYHEDQVANLHGEDWREFLVKQLPEKKQASFNQQFCLLQTYLYRQTAHTQADFASIVEQVRIWINCAVLPSTKAQIKDRQSDV